MIGLSNRHPVLTDKVHVLRGLYIQHGGYL